MTETPATYTPAAPPKDAVRDDEKTAYQKVIDRQRAYNYPEFVKKFPHRSVRQGMPGDTLQPYFAALLNSPLVAAGMSDLGVVYRTRGEFAGGMAHADREWCDMVVCQDLGMNWVLYVHALDAAAVGVRPAAILALVQGDEAQLTADEKLRADFIRAVIRGTMTRELYTALESRTSQRAAVEIAAFSGHLLKTIRLQQAFGIPDIPRADLVEFLEAIAAGTITPPDPKERVPVAAPHG
ncbi:carboxymuconolactone decarboxylase family protein [Chelatococcus asaccharovorans]|uniref:Uncharacterized protein n=1 Tax=Chelatococcus asaccharovorans TaxID=28210 RepID=A0A2V3TWC1_9HYPH|nr:hypothetical protein [Chelatococcus asaccharovorans]MBS7706183.1 hypothetical protein [Chelatococcus asaccharovorans]PXW52558.1 hypothetical protein C7450_116132 [Chelatococcus asaccharovorans]CAH1660204.1 conserved hypothetical protein [Chelatococcus asaccharovorans]CAH1683893.1 conserved hypothetical protein [Chelatococcus asaccharovorans]